MAITLDGTNGVTTPDLTVDTTTLTVDNTNNRVGIGTTSPPDHLSVVTTGANAQLSVDRTDGGAGRTVLIHSSTGGQLQTTGSVPLIFGTADIERMRINSNGHITTPNQPAFMAHKNGNQALTAHTLTKITSWTENTDQSNSWDNTNARFTAPTAGIYLFGILMQSNILGGLHCMIRKNGNNGTYGDNYLDGGNISGGSYTLMMPMAANDYVEYLAYLTANGNINAGRSKAWAVKVG